MSLTRQDLDRLEKEALSCVGDYDCGYLAPDVLQLIPMARRSLELEEVIKKIKYLPTTDKSPSRIEAMRIAREALSAPSEKEEKK